MTAAEIAIPTNISVSRPPAPVVHPVEEIAPVIPILVPSPPEHLRPKPMYRNRLLIAAVGLLVVIAALVAFLANRPVPVAPAVASAAVNVPDAAVYKKPDAESGKIVNLRLKDRVNVLETPQTNQSWVRIQYVSPEGRAFQPGYVRIGELTDWDSRDPDEAFLLIRMFGLSAAGTTTQIVYSLRALERFVGRFPKAQAAFQAHLLMAELEVKLAGKMKSNGDPPNVWQARLESAKNDIATVSGDAALQNQASILLKQVEDLTGHAARQTVPVESQAPPQVTAPAISVSNLLAQAEKYRSQHDFDMADALVTRVLQREPGNAAALAMRDRIKKNRSFFGDQR